MKRVEFEAYLKDLKNKSVSVIGLGVSNRPLIELLLKSGAKVTARDKKETLGEYGLDLTRRGCDLRLGEDYLKDLNQDIIFRTPGMRPDLPELQEAVQHGSILTSEMEIFFEVCPCPILAVTGSDGKTTTTTILANVFQSIGKKVWLGGNIGHPLLAETGDIKHLDLAVLELSSFQLMTMKKSPRIAVITNISPNHLDVHKDYQEYIQAKENIFKFQKPDDLLILNYDNTVTREEAARAPGRVRMFSRKIELKDGVFLRGEQIISRKISRNGEISERVIMNVSDINLPGAHNIENYLAVIAAADDQIPDDNIKTFAREFKGVEHRIELFRTRRGVRWYNDSIASSPSRTIAGLNAFQDNKLILIAGGKDKGISYRDLGPVINAHVKYLILCGATAGVIRESVKQADNYSGLKIQEVSNYPDAVKLADEIAKPGDIVILSPASTSFDRFANFMERGEVFKKLVNDLPE